MRCEIILLWYYDPTKNESYARLRGFNIENMPSVLHAHLIGQNIKTKWFDMSKSTNTDDPHRSIFTTMTEQESL